MRAALALAVLPALLSPGCTKRETPRASQVPVLRIGIDRALETLDPARAPEGLTLSVLSNIFEPLVAFDAQMKLVPALAERWSTPDDRTWVFELRAPATFHDGTPLTSERVASALSRARDDPESLLRSRLASVESVKADGKRVLVRTLRPDAFLLQELANVLLAQEPPASGRAVGTGPYRLARYEKGGDLELAAFEEHWSGRPRIPRVAFAVAPTGDASVSGLKSGHLHVARIPARAVVEPAASRGFDVPSSPGLVTSYLAFGLADAAGADNPLRDRRLRLAMERAIDRKALTRKLVGHESSYATQLVPPSIFGFAPDLPPPPVDPAGARALVEEWSREGGGRRSLPVRLTLHHREGAEDLLLAETLEGMLEAAGFDITRRALPLGELIAEATAQRLPLFLLRWSFEGGDAGTFLRDCVRSRDLASKSGLFNAGYANPEMDALIDESATIFDGFRRLEHLGKVMRLAQEDVPLIPLFHRPDIWGVSRHVSFEPRLDGRLLAQEISFRPDPAR